MKKYIEPAIKVKFLGTESEMMAAFSMHNEPGDGNQMSKEYDNWEDEEDDE